MKEDWTDRKFVQMVGGCNCSGKCLILPVILATVFILVTMIYFSDNYKSSIVIFSLVSDIGSERNATSVPSPFTRDHVSNWLETCAQLAPLFLIEPYWLQCLQSKKLARCLNNQSTSAIRFAVVSDAKIRSDSLMRKVLTMSGKLGWTSDNVSSPLQAFRLTKENSTILISLMETWRKYWYLHGIGDEKPRAFRGLNLTVSQWRKEGKYDLLIPYPIDLYLWQWPRSRFLECNRSSVEYLHRYYPQLYSAPAVIPDSYVEILAHARNIFTKYRVTVMLAGGTALGWYRECGFIPHTTDTDMSFPAWEYKAEIEQAFKKDNIFKLHWILGRVEDGMEITVNARANKIDIFALYDRGNETFVGAMNVGERTKLRWWYPKFDGICTGDLLGELFFVRCDIVAVFEIEYGPRWYEHHHSAQYVWHSSHFNVQKVGVYSDQEWPYVYRTF